MIRRVLSKMLTKGHVSNIDNRGTFWPWIREPYSGAWQANDSWTIDTVLAYHAVYACITLIANDIGKLRLLLMRKDADGIWEESSLPKFDRLFKKPNSYQNHIQFKQWWFTSKLIKGNTYGLKVRDQQGNIVAIFILDPGRIQPLVAPDGSVFYHIGQDDLNKVETGVTVPASEIIHDRMNCLFHPLVGISPLFASGLAASQGISIQNDSKNFFTNGATPGGVLTAPGAISPEAAERLKLHWTTNYTGDNAGKIAVLGDGLKFEPMRMTSVDAQLIEQLKYSAEIVCSTFHVPAYKIGVGQVPSHNNIEALTQDYYSQCLQELIESFEACFDDGLEIPQNYKTQVDLDGLFRMDSATKIDTLSKGVGGQIYAPNEARKRMNLKPLPGGNSVYMQQQNYSLEALSRRDSKDDPFSKNGAPMPDNENEARDSIDDDEAETARAIFGNLAKANPLTIGGL